MKRCAIMHSNLLPQQAGGGLASEAKPGRGPCSFVSAKRPSSCFRSYVKISRPSPGYPTPPLSREGSVQQAREGALVVLFQRSGRPAALGLMLRSHDPPRLRRPLPLSRRGVCGKPGRGPCSLFQRSGRPSALGLMLRSHGPSPGYAALPLSREGSVRQAREGALEFCFSEAAVQLL